MARARVSKTRRVLLPVLGVLRSMKPEQRIILLAHLDDPTRDALYRTIGEVLHSDKVPRKRRLTLKGKLEPYKKELRYLANAKRTSASRKKRALAQIGGGPLSHVLGAAIPLLLDTFRA